MTLLDVFKGFTKQNGETNRNKGRPLSTYCSPLPFFATPANKTSPIPSKSIVAGSGAEADI